MLKLNRRQILKAAGFAVALPFLEAHAATPAPIRLINFFWPNGVNLADWDNANGVSRQTLSAVAGDVNVIRNLSNNGVGAFNRANLGGYGSHGCGGAAFATALDPGTGGASGPSFEQVAAAQLGGATRFRSLVMSGQTNTPYSTHFHNQSWRGPNNPEPPQRDPVKVYDALFSAGLPSMGAPSTLLRDRRSVLDFMKAEHATLSARLGAADKARLDEHLTAIRDLELQLTDAGTSPPVTCTTLSRPAASSDIATRATLYSALIARAFACDLTRFVTFQLTDAMYENGLVSGSSNDHDVSHGTDAGSISTIIRSTQFKMAQLAKLITALKSVPEGAGTLLDNTIIYASSEIGDSAAHGWGNMPIVLAGRGGGKIATGRNLNFQGKNIGDLFATLLNVAGVPTAKFGFGAGTLGGL